jgi:hypothetical protein
VVSECLRTESASCTTSWLVGCLSSSTRMAKMVFLWFSLESGICNIVPCECMFHFSRCQVGSCIPLSAATLPVYEALNPPSMSWLSTVKLTRQGHIEFRTGAQFSDLQKTDPGYGQANWPYDLGGNQATSLQHHLSLPGDQGTSLIKSLLLGMRQQHNHLLVAAGTWRWSDIPHPRPLHRFLRAEHRTEEGDVTTVIQPSLISQPDVN